MPLEFDLLFEETPPLDITLETLQFVGIFDHSQLKNCDLENQHPVTAISGLTETLHSTNNHLNALTERLDEVDLKIENQEKTIENQRVVLVSHDLSLDELTRFKNNIAPANIVEEVLQNG